jgi:dTMP kinase
LKKTISLQWASTGLLFAADRLEHIEQIHVTLHQGVTVVSDRYVLSSLVYQSLAARQTGFDWPDSELWLATWLREINRFAGSPDLTIVLRCDPEIAAERRQRRRAGEVELFDDLDFQRRCADYYNRASEWLPDAEIAFVSAEGSIEETQEAILQCCKEHGLL